MNPQAQAILTLFESLPTEDKQVLFETISSRFQLSDNPVVNKMSKAQRHRAKVMEYARILNNNTAN